MLQLIAQQFGEGITDNSSFFGGVDSAANQNAYTNLELLISNMIGLLTVLGGIFFIFTFVIGALTWITASGDSGKIEKARDQMIQGVVGLIIIVAAYAIIGLIGAVVGLDLLTPGESLRQLQPGGNSNANNPAVIPGGVSIP